MLKGMSKSRYYNAEYLPEETSHGATAVWNVCEKSGIRGRNRMGIGTCALNGRRRMVMTVGKSSGAEKRTGVPRDTAEKKGKKKVIASLRLLLFYASG